MNRETPSNSLQVEFFPSADDYAYIASRISNSVPRPSAVRYAYQAFLLVNAIVFPAFLWFLEYYLVGFLILVLNAILLRVVLPWMGSVGLKSFYEHTFGDRERHVVNVELNSEGIEYASENGTLFLPWRRVVSIEENDDALFFFFEGNGIAVRKSGFAYREAQVEFLNFARHCMAESKNNLLET